jgi:hypothetical protein
MEALSTQIALAIYGVAIVFALWYRVASDGGRRRDARAANGPAESAQPSSPAQKPALSLRAGSRQDGLRAARGPACVVMKRDDSSVSR